MKKIIDDAFLTMLDRSDLNVDRSMRGMFGGERRTNAFGSSLDFADYREYLPGDDLRLIDRNLFMRFEKLYIKLFTDERQLFHRIYIDASASMNWGEHPKKETALKMAAALSYMAVRHNDRVAISTVHRDKCLPVCPPFSGAEKFYDAAMKMNGIRFSGETCYIEALSGKEELGRDDGFSIVISDFLNEESYRDTVELLLFKGRRVHLLQVLSRDEIDPGFRGRALLLDSEARGEEDERNYRVTVDRSRIKAYKQALSVYQKELRDFCRARGAGFFTVCSDDPIERILFNDAAREGLIV